MAMKGSLSTRPRSPQLSTSTLSPEEQVRLLRGLRGPCWGDESSVRPDRRPMVGAFA